MTPASGDVAAPPQGAIRREVPRRRRRHRWLTVPSGWLLFVCVFVPSMRVCEGGEAFPMALVPPAWPPYVAGLLVALAANATRDTLTRRGMMLFSLVRVSVLGCGVMVLLPSVDGGTAFEAAAIIVAGALYVAIPWPRPTELRVALYALLAAGLAAAWGLALALARLAVWGAELTAIAACALTVGSLWWVLEVLWACRSSRDRVP